MNASARPLLIESEPVFDTLVGDAKEPLFFLVMICFGHKELLNKEIKESFLGFFLFGDGESLTIAGKVNLDTFGRAILPLEKCFFIAEIVDDFIPRETIDYAGE